MFVSGKSKGWQSLVLSFHSNYWYNCLPLALCWSLVPQIQRWSCVESFRSQKEVHPFNTGALLAIWFVVLSPVKNANYLQNLHVGMQWTYEACDSCMCRCMTSIFLVCPRSHSFTVLFSCRSSVTRKKCHQVLNVSFRRNEVCPRGKKTYNVAVWSGIKGECVSGMNTTHLHDTHKRNE
jgi:hypothetical protein